MNSCKVELYRNVACYSAFTLATCAATCVATGVATCRQCKNTIREARAGKRMQIDQQCQPRKFIPENVVSSHVMVMRIFAGAGEIWGVKKAGVV